MNSINDEDDKFSDMSFYEIEGNKMPRESLISNLFSCEVQINYNCAEGHLT